MGIINAEKLIQLSKDGQAFCKKHTIHDEEKLSKNGDDCCGDCPLKDKGCITSGGWLEFTAGDITAEDLIERINEYEKNLHMYNKLPYDKELMENHKWFGCIDRKGYTFAIQGACRLTRGIQYLRQCNATMGEPLDFNGPEAAFDFLERALIPKEKSRIVIDYDPAADKVIFYVIDADHHLPSCKDTQQEAKP